MIDKFQYTSTLDLIQGGVDILFVFYYDLDDMPGIAFTNMHETHFKDYGFAWLFGD